MKNIFVCITILGLLLIACSEEKKNGQRSIHDIHDTTSITQDPVKTPATKGNSNELMFTNSQIALANITTEEVLVRPVGQTIVVNARLSENEERTEVVSSRSTGRVEKLYIKETGAVVRAGEPLYELYSEALLTLQREYLLAKEQFEALGREEPRYESFLKASERKLLLYGLTKDQVVSLAQSKTIRQRITFLAPAPGVVSEISVSEGQYVEEGAMLYRIENVAMLWVEAELYPGESEPVRLGDKIRVSINGFDSAPMEARVVFLSPEYRVNTQVTIMRATVNNPELKLRPGMQAQVFITRATRNAVAIPADAVIRDGKGTHVYVETGTNTFRPRMVRTGGEDFEQVEITEGLVAGERIAVTGAYLLYSEMVLKKGTDPHAGH